MKGPDVTNTVALHLQISTNDAQNLEVCHHFYIIEDCLVTNNLPS